MSSPYLSDNKQHDVYNATSRSVDLPLHSIPSSLIQEEELQQYNESQNRVHREEIDFASNECAQSRGFVLKNFFSATECDALIAATEGIGYNQHSDVPTEYPKDYRSNSRLIVFQHAIAAAIWSRLLPHLREADFANVTPIGFATQGLWLPIGVNECLLFSRYEEGQFFKPHNDGMYQSFEGDCSIFTITIYLNDNFSGGRVKFLRGTAAENSLVHTFQPERGAALIFNHDTLHEGEKVESGQKYILRTSIMFRRVQDLTDPLQSWHKNRDWQRMHDMFASFTDLQNEKDPAKFTARFLAAQTIQLQNGRSIHSPVPLPIPVDIFREIIAYASLPTLLNMFAVSQSAKQVTRSGRVWKARVASRLRTNLDFLLKSDPLLSRADPALVDWYPVFKRIYKTQSAFDPMAAYITATTIYSRSLDSDPWDCSFGWWAITDKIEKGHGWISGSNQVRAHHVMCLLKTAARAINLPFNNLPNRALVIVVQPIYRRAWESTEYDINQPKEWECVREICMNILYRWKMAAFGIITTIFGALSHGRTGDALVVTSSRAENSLTHSTIRIYVCHAYKVTETLTFQSPRSAFSAFFEGELPTLAKDNGVKTVLFITDVDPLNSKVEWGDAEEDDKLREVISDIFPSHVTDFAASAACKRAELEAVLVRPRDLINSAMEMACTESYNDMWFTKSKEFSAFQKLRPDNLMDEYI